MALGIVPIGNPPFAGSMRRRESNPRKVSAVPYCLVIATSKCKSAGIWCVWSSLPSSILIQRIVPLKALAAPAG